MKKKENSASVSRLRDTGEVLGYLSLIRNKTSRSVSSHDMHGRCGFRSCTEISEILYARSDRKKTAYLKFIVQLYFNSLEGENSYSMSMLKIFMEND